MIAPLVLGIVLVFLGWRHVSAGWGAAAAGTGG
ncbi:hypothetical protein BH20CHL7_BH20CHL7_12020 [soil metagenome]